MDDTSKNDSSKLASQIIGSCGDDPKEKFQFLSDEAPGSHHLQLEFCTKSVELFAGSFKVSAIL